MKKSISLSLLLIFSLSLLAATGFSRSDCGQVCCCTTNMQGMQHSNKYQARVNSNCCSQTSAHPCGYTKSSNVELPLCTLSTGRIGNGSPVSASSALSVTAVVNEFDLTRDRWPVAKIPIQSSPLYLQHNSLII